MLTLLLAAVGIVALFPLGPLLALGRQSKLPVIRVYLFFLSVAMMFGGGRTRPTGSTQRDAAAPIE